MTHDIDFKRLLTPQQAHELNPATPVEQFERAARSRNRCVVCTAAEWRLAGVGLCFTCTTGEASPANDYELARI